MMQSTATLMDFLLARIAEDEAAARAAEADAGASWQSDDGMVDGQIKHRRPRGTGLWDNEGASSLSMEPDVAEFVARNDPARVLAECDAKRRIIGHEAQVHRFGDAVARQIIDNVLAMLALPWADHPDYREEWRI